MSKLLATCKDVPQPRIMNLVPLNNAKVLPSSVAKEEGDKEKRAEQSEPLAAVIIENRHRKKPRLLALPACFAASWRLGREPFEP